MDLIKFEIRKQLECHLNILTSSEPGLEKMCPSRHLSQVNIFISVADKMWFSGA